MSPEKWRQPISLVQAMKIAEWNSSVDGNNNVPMFASAY